MQDLDIETELQHIGEIAIIGPTGSAKYHFIHSLCRKPIITDHDIIFGRFDVNPELSLFLYGIGYEYEQVNFAWDLVANKILGYIVLFDWYNDQSFKVAQNILDFLTAEFDAPITVAADVFDRPFPVQTSIFRPSISLSHQTQFTFCRSNNPASVKKVVVSLLDMLINRLS